jgi:hypothetical protein
MTCLECRSLHLTFPHPPLIANQSPVEIKHAGKQHKVEFNPVGDAKAFKESIYQVTGVPTGKFHSTFNEKCVFLAWTAS